MALEFLNQDRSYEPSRRRIRFCGQDDAKEVVFFLDEDAIFRLAPRTRNTEEGMLSAFDTAHQRIRDVAARLYAPTEQRSFYILPASAF